jgi:hypothetical protein
MQQPANQLTQGRAETHGSCTCDDSTVLLTERPVRVTDVEVQPLRVAVPVAGYAALDLTLQVLEGTDVEVRVLTGMQCDSEEGWVEVDRFVPTSAPVGGAPSLATRKCFFPLLRYARWEVLSSTSATFLIHGVGRSRLGFVPTEIDGCILWLRSDLSVTLASGKVSSWGDRSGKENHFVQGVAASRPTYVASHGSFKGQPTLSFDGTDDSLSTPVDFLSPGGVDAFWVLKMASDPPGLASETGLERFGTAAQVTHYPFTDGVVYMGFASSSRKTVGNPTQDLTKAHLLEVISTGSQYAVTIGGRPEFSGAGSFAWNTRPIVGESGSSTRWLKGDVAELVFYDRALSDAERSRAIQYFKGRYNL